MNAPRPRLPPRSALVLTACALLVLAFAPAQHFGRQQDDVLYYLGARALASGRYCLLTAPGCPPLTMINPAWPALLAPLSFAGESPAPSQALSALLLALTPAVLWLWLRRRVGGTTALLGAALFASCPLALSQSGVVMSEVPYTLLLLGGLLAADADKAGAAGAASAALLLTRTAGLAALPGLLAPFRRRPAALAAAGLPPVLAFAAWSAWSLRAAGAVGKFDLLPATYGSGRWTRLSGVAAANARWYAAEWGGCFLPARLAGSPLALLLGGALAAVAACGVFRALRRRRDDPAAWTLLGSAALLAAWGWQYERYLLPILPLLVWALARGLGRRAPRALGALLVLQVGLQVAPRLGRPGPWAEPELSRTYAWLSARPRPALLTSASPIRDGWLSGLPQTALPVAPDAASFAAALKAMRVSLVLRAEGQDYGLDADPGSTLRGGLERSFSYLDDPRLFRQVHEEPSERARVYEPR
ncbi:MAG: hypothetical protein HY079_03715 [Elusimicrobia bacterium]|nr:hypothetical protein [Elusimicrobiota bacterium]